MAPTHRTVATLKANPKNPRTITAAKRRMLAAALDKYGDLGGIVYNRRSGQLVGGHQRVAALDPNTQVCVDKSYDSLTRTGTVAEGYAIIAGERYAYREVDWDDVTEKAANLAANKGAGEFDLDQVSEWLADIDAAGFDLDLTMFDADERIALETEPTSTTIRASDEAPALPNEPKSRTNDIYLMGDHRLMCGNSSDPAAVKRLMGNDLADMVFTDPPYNHAGADKIVAANIRKSYANLKLAEWDKAFSFKSVENIIAASLAKDATVYVSTSHHLFGEIISWMQSWAGQTSYCVWTKNNPMPSLQKRHYTWSTELICYGTRGKHIFNFPKQGHALNVWPLAKSVKNDLHPTMKPVGVPAHAIGMSSKEGQIVADFFGGAGSTLMACEDLGRRCRMMEIDPAYCDVIISRWEAMTGQKAQLVGNRTAKESIDA